MNPNFVFTYENSDIKAHKIFQNRIYAQFYELDPRTERKKQGQKGLERETTAEINKEVL